LLTIYMTSASDSSRTCTTHNMLHTTQFNAINKLQCANICKKNIRTKGEKIFQHSGGLLK